jgi:hypothetical protein
LACATNRYPGTLLNEIIVQSERRSMSKVTYEIVEHDGGWAYKVDGVFSEPFPSHAAALKAAQRAAAEQKVPGHTEEIQFEDEKGRWHTETASGSDRPDTSVKDES